MTLLFHEWLIHREFRVLVICSAFFFFRNVNPTIPKISKFSNAKEFKFPPVAHLDKKIKVCGTSSQLVCPLIYTPVYKLARILISQDLQLDQSCIVKKGNYWNCFGTGLYNTHILVCKTHSRYANYWKWWQPINFFIRNV